MSTAMLLTHSGGVTGDLLADLALGQYSDPVKLGLVTILAGIWLGICGWVDRDAVRVKTNHTLWVGVIYGAGVLGFILGLLLPWSGALFVVGFLLYAAVVALSTVIYIRQRNGLVAVDARVSLGSMFRRAVGWFSGKEVKAEVSEKIKIADAGGNQLKVPRDNEEQLAYAAAQELLVDAITRRASDVDVVPAGEQIRIAYRIDGVVAERDPLDRETGDKALLYLKRIAGLDVEERRRPQVGTIEASRGISGEDLSKQVQIEVRTSGSTAGERMMLRIMADEAHYRLPDLGLTDQQLGLLEALASRRDGLVIVSGPKSCGLTSTLYAFLRGSDCFTQNIHTLETDPSMDLENITQNEFDGQEEGVTFGRRLQSVIRRDPDILMISECPDKETAGVIARAAGERKRIYLGMNAKSCLEAVKRYVRLVGDPKLAAEALRAVISQRLVRVLCENCREPYKPDPEMLRKANLPADRIDVFYKAVGTIPDKDGNPVTCPLCHGTGYVGRTAVYEIMILSDSMREALGAGDLASVKSLARKHKPPMLYLQEEGLRKVMAGKTSMKEFLRAVASDNGG
ncbi:MAG: Flp pilus assembly complex ATPase component TadA [Phycisphaerae bacterium]|nr:Flp pilus assembly complex ATPase component TadA [Phycisphaerae bacterium]